VFSLLLACTPQKPDTSIGDTDPAPIVQDTGEPSILAALCGELDEPAPAATVPRVTLRSVGTWTVDFDDAAEANGGEDCTYTRVYEGTSFVDAPWVCPDCAFMTAGQAVMQDGADCFAVVSDASPDRAEFWGLADGVVRRSSVENQLLGTPGGQQTELGDGEGTWSWTATYPLSDGGELTLSAAGTLEWAPDGELLVPYEIPRQTPYAAGWTQSDPGDLVQDWSPAIGQTFPNSRLQDQCGDHPVDLWDLHGEGYVILDVSQPDCGPCQVMAREFVDLADALAYSGIEVSMVTYMGAGLQTPLLPPELETVQLWSETYGVHGPVFVDRGFATNAMRQFVQNELDRDMGFPAWVILAPDLSVIHGQVGFGDWVDAHDRIVAHAE
jgi:thiol-disulfide isomerase/thioredoxin